jgi:uncharacterized protein YoxC
MTDVLEVLAVLLPTPASLAQSVPGTDAVSAAGELWGPAGIIIAVIVIAVIVYLVKKERSLSSQVQDLQEGRLQDAKGYSEKLMQRDRDTMATLRDVMSLLDKLEASDASLHSTMDSVRGEVIGKINDLRQDLNK